MIEIIDNGEKRNIRFLIDSEMTEEIIELGNWHPRVAKQPSRYAPVIRRKSPNTGMPVEIRLPMAVCVLHTVLKEQRMKCVRDFQIFINLCHSRPRISKLPLNGDQNDCRIVNWYKGQIVDLPRSEIEILNKDLEQKMSNPETWNPKCGSTILGDPVTSNGRPLTKDELEAREYAKGIVERERALTEFMNSETPKDDDGLPLYARPRASNIPTTQPSVKDKNTQE